MFVVLGNATVDEAMAAEVWPTPGHTVVVGAPVRDLGGKGANQGLVLMRTGAAVRFVAAVGRDPDGDRVAAALVREGLAASDLIRVDYATDRSLIFVGPGGENAIASTTDCARAVDAATAEAVVAGMRAGDGLVLQGNLTLETTRAALAAARKAGVRTIFNPSPIQGGFTELLPLVDLLVLNEGEAAILGGGADDVLGTLHAAGAAGLVLTLGGRGAIGSDGREAIQVAARPVAVVDTTGAGDTFMGVLVAALYDRGLAMRPALEAARDAAAITVQRSGTLAAFPSAREIAAIFQRQAA
jgi:ribokinase